LGVEIRRQFFSFRGSIKIEIVKDGSWSKEAFEATRGSLELDA